MLKVKFITSFTNADFDHKSLYFNLPILIRTMPVLRAYVLTLKHVFGGSRVTIKADISILAQRLSVFTTTLPIGKVFTILNIKCQVKYLNLIIKMLRQSIVIY